MAVALPVLLALVSAGPGPAPGPPAAVGAAEVARTRLDCPRASAGQIVVDGFFQEWDENADPQLRLGEGPDLVVELRCARAGDELFLVVAGRDDSFRASSPKGGGGDRVRVSVLDGLTFEIDPGDLEDRLPHARWLPGRTKGFPPVKVDGATRDWGWILEIGVSERPLWELGWRTTGMTGEIEVVDEDKEGPPTTSRWSLDLRNPEAYANLGLWLTHAGMDARRVPDKDLFHDVAGDPRPERVIVAGGVVGVIGEGIGENVVSGEELPFADEGEVIDVTMRDLNGDGADEILVTQKVPAADERSPLWQELLHVLHWTDGGLLLLLSLEVANASPTQRVENVVRYVPPGKKARKKGADAAWTRVEVRPGKAQGVRESTYVDPDANFDAEYQPILLPWGFTKKAVYGFESGRYIRQ